MIDFASMGTPTIIGFVGVGLLLMAFVLNLLRRISEQSNIYLVLNATGAFMAAFYAYTESLLPFVILELVWGGVALLRLLGPITKRLLRR